ncbi:MAG: DUF1295 domain-containing protein [Gammaproteobacteria bacterium]
MLHALLTNWAIVAIIMLITWLAFLFTKNYSLIDMMWPIGFIFAGIEQLNYTCYQEYSGVALMLLLLWGGRLAGHIFWNRVRLREIDQRYVALSKGWKINKAIGFLVNYQFQGLLIVLISLPTIAIAHSNKTHVTNIDHLLMVFCLMAITLEMMADAQLKQFKQTSHDKQPCKTGLWRCSRHPNLFFDWCFWLGFSLLSWNSSQDSYVIVSPILLFAVMYFVTIPLTEKQSLKSRGEAYRLYQAETTKFFPWVSH